MMDFYDTPEWLSMRYRVLSHYGRVCQLCGVHGKGVVIQVDHIKPRSKYPELELEFTNLKVLCKPCNGGKSNIYLDDWRKPSVKPKINPGKLCNLISKIG